MTLTIIDVDQRSPEWYAARCGIVTASLMDKLITVAPPDATVIQCPICEAEVGGPCLNRARKEPTEIKTFHDARKEKAAALPPAYEPATGDVARGIWATLAAERVTGHVEDTPMTSDMWRGVDSEPYARDLYAEHDACGAVDEVGFMVREFDGFRIGYSPDALVGDDGLLEIKAPRQKGQLSVVVDGKVPGYYTAQCQTGILVSGRKWIDFLPYNGGMHLPHPIRVTPDPRWRDAILAAARLAEEKIADLVDRYLAAVEGRPMTERIDFNAVTLKLGGAA